MSKGRLVALLPLVLASCATSHAAEQPLQNVAIPVRDPSSPSSSDDDAREDPPESDAARSLSLPTVSRSHLATGVELVVARQRSAGLVEVRVVLPAAGTSADGERTGLAALTAELVLHGGAGKLPARELASRFATLGVAPRVKVHPDGAEISLAASRDRLAEALDLLASTLREPKLDPADHARIKRQMRAERALATRASSSWITSMLVARELFKLPVSVHPYASFDASPGELDRLTVTDTKAFFKQRYTPTGASLVVTGDLDPADARALADKAFGAWKGTDAPGLSFTAPVASEATRVFVADMPGLATSRIVIAAVVTERLDESWPALLVASEILGGTSSARLANGARDATALSSAIRASLAEVARGPTPWTVEASAEGPRTGATVHALLEELRRAASNPVADTEVAAARRRLTDGLALRLVTAHDTADFLSQAAILRLPDDFAEKLIAQLRAVDPSSLGRALHLHPLWPSLIVVCGDAGSVAPQLTRFGEVMILAPERNFERLRTLPMQVPPPAVKP